MFLSIRILIFAIHTHLHIYTSTHTHTLVRAYARFLFLAQLESESLAFIVIEANIEPVHRRVCIDKNCSTFLSSGCQFNIFTLGALALSHNTPLFPFSCYPHHYTTVALVSTFLLNARWIFLFINIKQESNLRRLNNHCSPLCVHAVKSKEENVIKLKCVHPIGFDKILSIVRNHIS